MESGKGKSQRVGMPQKKATLVLGGTGKTGRRVVDRLVERGVPVQIGSRSSVPSFDWEDEATWAPALWNVDAVYVSYYPDLAVPRAVEKIRSFADLVTANGIRRLVLLSGRREKGAEACERAVTETEADWTILRASWFCQNFSESYLLEPVLRGEVILPAGEVPEPFIDVEDIADVAAACLTEEGHVGRIYELTGPRTLTFERAVEEIAHAAGKRIDYVQVTPEEYASFLLDRHVPEEFVWLLKYLFTNVLDGRNAHVATGVQQAIGRKPKDFSQFAYDAAVKGIWGKPRRIAESS